MNAEKAYELTISSIDDVIQNKTNFILDGIEKKAKSGYDSCSFRIEEISTIVDKVIKNIEEKGFRVHKTGYVLSVRWSCGTNKLKNN